MANTMKKHEQPIDIPSTSNASLPAFLSGNREDYLNLNLPLYEASITGDWETAKLMFDKRPDLVQFGLTKNLDTALHVAAIAEETRHTLNFVKNLVNMLTKEELEMKNKLGNTAFYIACTFGNTKMAKMMMMEKNQGLLYIRGGSDEHLPLSASALAGKYNSVKYLYDISEKMSRDHGTDDDMHLTLLHCVESGFFAFRFFRMEEQPVSKEYSYALNLLEFILGYATRKLKDHELYGMLTAEYFSRSNILFEAASSILFEAAEAGNTRFLVELLRTNPYLMLSKDRRGHTIFHIAVIHRHLDIYNLLFEIGDFKKEICVSRDDDGNNMLHLVGRSSSSHSRFMAAKTSEASLFMQRELLWFKLTFLQPFPTR
ncbi:uncharacterized protein LOC143545626 [Bidens hawaiensis]|uniref:uncharacterized protein LOC143545626 n=1 Tax=Bidens hawaiensis TaxID=980011 RepID=UPI00404A08C5